MNLSVLPRAERLWRLSAGSSSGQPASLQGRRSDLIRLYLAVGAVEVGRTKKRRLFVRTQGLMRKVAQGDSAGATAFFAATWAGVQACPLIGCQVDRRAGPVSVGWSGLVANAENRRVKNHRFHSFFQPVERKVALGDFFALVFPRCPSLGIATVAFKACRRHAAVCIREDLGSGQ